MPNWCSNWVTLQGSEANLENAINALLNAPKLEDSYAILNDIELEDSFDETRVFALCPEGYAAPEHIDEQKRNDMILSAKRSGSFFFTFESKHNTCPLRLTEFCRKYNVSMECEFEESGNYVYGKLNVTNDGTATLQYLEKWPEEDEEEMYVVGSERFESLTEALEVSLEKQMDGA